MNASFLSFRFQTKKLWLAALFPLLFVSDILYGGLDYYRIELPITPGVLLRGAVMLVAIYWSVKYHRLVGRVLWGWLLLLVLLVIPSLIVGVFHGQSPFFDLQFLFKVLYLPFTTALLVVLIKRYRICCDDVLQFIEYSAYVLGISLLLSQLLGIQRATYGDYAFGNTGIFYAQNDMTLAFGLSLLAAAYRVVLVRFSWIRLGLMLLSVYACLQIGTRASLGVLVGVTLTILTMMFWGKGESVANGVFHRLVKKALVVLFGVWMAIMIIYGIGKQQEHNFQQKKLEELAQGNFPRLILVVAGASHMAKRSGIFNITGEGMDAFARGVANYYPTSEERRFVEVDWMDIFGASGIGFTVAIYLFALKVLLGSVRRFASGLRDPLYGLIGAATFLYTGHSGLAGHALTSPIPTTLMAGFFGIYFAWGQAAGNVGRLGQRIGDA